MRPRTAVVILSVRRLRAQRIDEDENRRDAGLGLIDINLVSLAIDDGDARAGDRVTHRDLPLERFERAVGRSQNQGRHLNLGDSGGLDGQALVC